MKARDNTVWLCIAVRKALKVHEMTNHIIKPWQRKLERNNATFLHIPYFLGEPFQQEVKIGANQKQEALCLGSLHAVWHSAR